MADQIRDAIRACGMTQRHVAEQAGVTEAMISRFLAGRCWLGEETFNTLAEVLGLSLRVTDPKSEKGK